MIIYNKEWIDNLDIRNKCTTWLRKKLISSEESEAIKLANPTAYNNSNIFVRLGMFIFTVIVVSSALGFFSVFFDLTGKLFQLILLAVVLLFVTEIFFTKQNYYKSGVTDALLYMGLFSLCSSIIMIIDGNDFKFNADPLIYLIAITPFLIIATIRYADAFLALLSFGFIIVINAMLILKTGFVGKLILPFETMVLSYFIYAFTRKIKSNDKNRFWNNCLAMTETLSVSVFYLSGNYFVVRNLSEMLLGATYPPGTDISFAFFFYLFTILIPLLYVWRGLIKKDTILIRSGIVLEAIGILSIRYYYSILPAEIALIVGGLSLILIGWLSIRYLKSPRKGITFEQEEINEESASVLSSMIISEATSQMKAPDSATRFGGGESGGGGAGGNF